MWIDTLQYWTVTYGKAEEPIATNVIHFPCVCRHVSLQTTAHPVAAGTHRQWQVSRR